MTSCCPHGALPSLCSPSDYTPKGHEVTLSGDLVAYVSEPPSAFASAVIVGYDIYGFHGGRVRHICDELARAGHLVVLPDFFRGDCWTAERERDEGGNKMPFIQSHASAATLQHDLTAHVLPYLGGRGALRVGCVGFCFGGYVAFVASHVPGALACAVGVHSSIRLFALSGSDEVAAAARVTCPQMLLQAANDSDAAKEGGPVEAALRALPFGDQCVVQSFPTATHGWVPRGDLSDPVVRANVAAAMEQTVHFLEKHLGPTSSCPHVHA